MGKKSIIFGASTALCIAVLYQTFLKTHIFYTLGVGRKDQKIEEFPYKCRKIVSPLLDACEDIVLDTEGRRLYAACSTLENFHGWSPGGGKYNSSSRTLQDHISVLNIDTPGPDSLYGLHTLQLTDPYKSISPLEDKTIDLLSLDIEVLSHSRLRFWLVNIRPPVDSSGKLLDASKLGANFTIEVFEHERGGSELEFKKTILSESVFSPNNLVADGRGGVFITNDKNVRISKFPILDFLVGSGNVAHCDEKSSCTTAASKTFNFANGIARSGNTLFVSNTATSTISLFTIHSNNTLSLLTTIQLPMPIDNLSVDSNGDVFAAGFPNALAFLNSIEHPGGKVGASVFRIRWNPKEEEKGEGEWEVKKVLEDRGGGVLAPATVTVHDTVTGNIWLSGISAKGVTVCEKVEDEREGRRFVQRGNPGDCVECKRKAKKEEGETEL